MQQDPLFANKLAGAILGALLLFFGLPQLATAVLGGGHHGAGHGELALAYPIEFKSSAGSGGEAAPVADLATLLASASPDAGKRRAALCTSCHSFEKGGANMQGPNLWGIINRPIASYAGFNYSGAFKGLGGAWSYERLDAFLAAPQKYAPGTAMSFAGIAKPEQRAEMLAYLRSLADAPAPLPAPSASPGSGNPG